MVLLGEKRRRTLLLKERSDRQSLSVQARFLNGALIGLDTALSLDHQISLTPVSTTSNPRHGSTKQEEMITYQGENAKHRTKIESVNQLIGNG